MKDSQGDSDLSFDDEPGQEQFGSQPTRGLNGLAPGPGTSTPSAAPPAASAAASTAAPASSTAAPLMMASPWSTQTTTSQSSTWPPPPASSGLFGGQPQPGSLQPASQTAPVQVSASLQGPALTQPPVFSQTPPAQWSGLGLQVTRPPAASTPLTSRQRSLPATVSSQTQLGANQWQQHLGGPGQPQPGTHQPLSALQQPPPGPVQPPVVPGQPPPAGQQPQQGPLQLPPDSPALQA